MALMANLCAIFFCLDVVMENGISPYLAVMKGKYMKAATLLYAVAMTYLHVF